MRFELISIAIIFWLQGTSQRSRNCGTTCHETTESSNSCDEGTDTSADTDTNGCDTDKSDDNQKHKKFDNYVFVPYPIPIIVPPAVPMPMPQPYMPMLPPMCDGPTTQCNETTEATNSETTTTPPTTMLIPSPRKSCVDVARCSDRLTRKSQPYNEKVPNWLLKHGIMPLPDSLALDLVNKMEEIQRRNQTREEPATLAPYLPIRKVDQSIYRMNKPFETPSSDVVEELRDLFTPKQEKYPENNYNSNEVDLLSLMKTINGPQY